MSDKFILTIQAKDIIEEAIIATSDLPDDFSSLPVVEYINSSIFLKLTGLLEQKFRALTWIMADNDREYRRDFLRNRSFGEYSNYADKQQVYKDLLSQIFNYESNNLYINHKELAKQSREYIISFFNNTVFSSNFYNDFLQFINFDIPKKIKLLNITTQKETQVLIPNPKAKELFENIIKKRNKVAHNLEVNKYIKGDLSELCKNDEPNCDNIFICFWMLIYLDGILNETYKIYEEIMENI